MDKNRSEICKKERQSQNGRRSSDDELRTLARVKLTTSMKRADEKPETIPSSPRVKPLRASRTQTYIEN